MAVTMAAVAFFVLAAFWVLLSMGVGFVAFMVDRAVKTAQPITWRALQAERE